MSWFGGYNNSDSFINLDHAFLPAFPQGPQSVYYKSIIVLYVYAHIMTLFTSLKKTKASMISTLPVNKLTERGYVTYHKLYGL